MKIGDSCNRIDDAGCRRMAQSLTVNRTMHTLYLDRNNAGDEFGIEMGKTMLVNTTLRFLHLADNEIQATGAMALAKALANNNSLTWLDLSRNNMGNEGASEMASNSQKSSIQLLHIVTIARH